MTCQLWNSPHRRKRRPVSPFSTCRNVSTSCLCHLLVAGSILVLAASTTAQEIILPSDRNRESSPSSWLPSQPVNSHDSCNTNISAAAQESLQTVNDQTKSLLKDHDHHHDHHHDNHTDGETFCRGMYMVMFTDGFRWSLASNSNHHTNHTTRDDPSPCLAYYVASWKLSMSSKFRGAMVFSFLLALLTEGLSVSRFSLIQYLHFMASGGTGRNPPGQQRSRNHKLLLTVVYALQQWLGTMIMLVSMMYSIELLLSVVAGLALGNFVFVRDEHLEKQQQRQRQRLFGLGDNNTNSMGSRVGSLPPASMDPLSQQHAINDDGCHSNSAVTPGTATLPGVSRRSIHHSSSSSVFTGTAHDDGDEERQLMSTPTSMDGTESSLEMPTRKEE